MSVVALQQLLVLTVCCLLMHTHAWTPDPIALDKTAYCKGAACAAAYRQTTFIFTQLSRLS